jgi:antitoxin VapB
MAGAARAHARTVAGAPPSSPVRPVAPTRAKLVADGRGQAVRLPRDLRLPGTEVLVRRDGSRLVLEPLDAKGWPLDLWERLDALAQGLDDTWKRPPDAVPPPIGDERDLP